MATEFIQYYFTEAIVKALELNTNNQATIIKTITDKVADGTLVDFDAVLDSTTNVYALSFRYKNSTTSITINPGEIFVISNVTGKFSKMDATTFANSYTVNEPEGIILGKSILSE